MQPHPDHVSIDPDHPIMVVARARVELLRAAATHLVETAVYRTKYPESDHSCGHPAHEWGVLAHIPFGRHELDLQKAARDFITALDAPDSPWPLEKTIGAGVTRVWAQAQGATDA